VCVQHKQAAILIRSIIISQNDKDILHNNAKQDFSAHTHTLTHPSTRFLSYFFVFVALSLLLVLLVLLIGVVVHHSFYCLNEIVAAAAATAVCLLFTQNTLYSLSHLVFK